MKISRITVYKNKIISNYWENHTLICNVYTIYIYIMMSLHVCMCIRSQVLKVKDIASRETEGRVYTNDFENTLGFKRTS